MVVHGGCTRYICGLDSHYTHALHGVDGGTFLLELRTEAHRIVRHVQHHGRSGLVFVFPATNSSF